MKSREVKFKGGIDVQFVSETPQINTFKCIVQAKARTPVPHYHEKFDEKVTALVGTTTVTIDGKTTKLAAGNSALIPRGAVHQIANTTNETIEFLCEITPGIFGYEYFHDIEGIVNVEGPPDIDRFMAVMRNHGLVPVLGLKHKLIFAIVKVVQQLRR